MFSSELDARIQECFQLEHHFNMLLQKPNLSIAQKAAIQASKGQVIALNILLQGVKHNLGHFKGPKLKKLLGIASIIANIATGVNDLNELANLYCSIPDPCENDEEDAEALRSSVKGMIAATSAYFIGQIGADVAGLATMATGVAAEAGSAGAASAAALPAIGAAFLEMIVSWGKMKNNKLRWFSYC